MKKSGQFFNNTSPLDLKKYLDRLDRHFLFLCHPTVEMIAINSTSVMPSVCASPPCLDKSTTTYTNSG